MFGTTAIYDGKRWVHPKPVVTGLRYMPKKFFPALWMDLVKGTEARYVCGGRVGCEIDVG
jgi:hypothetical protein